MHVGWDIYDAYEAAWNALAHEGEEGAPILSITLLLGGSAIQRRSGDKRFECEVSLMSGTSFHLEFCESPLEPVATLARMLVRQLPQQTEGRVRPIRVFMTFKKENDDDLPITVWDHARPLSEFIYCCSEKLSPRSECR